MLLKVTVLIYSVFLKITISSQPVKEDNLMSNSQQRIYEECCPCPKFSEDDRSLRDQESSPTYRTSFSRQPAENCPRLSSEADSLGSSSVFRPFIMRDAEPGEKHGTPKQDMKRLLQPEVGLASSVLETLKKATDEEYEDALARDAARNAAKMATDNLDTETGNSRNSVTILVNPSEDLYTDDAIPEASHVQETRCIHGPLGRQMVDNTHTFNPKPKEYLMKRKPSILSHKSHDMDNSASSIQERLQEYCNNNLGNKLKMNPLLLNKFPNNFDGQFQDNSNPLSGPGFQLQRASPQYYEDLDKNTDNQINNGPAARLAALKNRLRDLSEKRNSKLLQNDVNKAKSNQLSNFNYKPGNLNAESSDLEADTNSHEDLQEFFNKQSPVVKTIQKFKDVELISPIKRINNGLMRETNADLKVAGTENNEYVRETEDNNMDEVNEVSRENDKVTNDSYSNKLGNGNKISSEEGDVIENSYETQSADEIITDSKDLNQNNNQEEIQIQTDEDKQNTDPIIQGDENFNILKDDFQNKSKEDIDDKEDSIPEMSNNVIQISNREEDTKLNDENEFENNNNDGEYFPSENFMKTDNNQRNLLRKNGINSNLLKQNKEDVLSFKEDLRRRLENLKKGRNLKLKEPENNLSVNPQSDSEDKVRTQIITSQYSLEKDEPLESEYQEDKECNSVDNLKRETEDNRSKNELNGIKSLPTDLNSKETQLVENLVKNFEIAEDDDSKIRTKQEDNYLQKVKSICDRIADGNFGSETKKVISEDSLPSNEMLSQASTFSLNAIRPTNENNYLKSPLEDIIVQPSHLTDIIHPNTFQLPTLEDIRQGITDIINAGEQEVEEYRSILSDSINESSNDSPFSSVNTNLLPGMLKARPNRLTETLVNRNNIYPYQSKASALKTEPLKGITLKPLFKMAGTPKDGLTLGSSRKPVAKPSLKLPSPGFAFKDVPSLENLREFLHDRSNSNLMIPRKNVDKIAFSPKAGNSFADNTKYKANKALKSNLLKSKEGKHLLSKAKPESNGFLEAMDQKREDLNDKIEALHIDFNDRLASIHEKLTDQPNLQSMNIPITDWYNNVPSLLGLGRDREPQNLLSSKLHNFEGNLPSGSNLRNMYERRNHNEINPLELSSFNPRTRDRNQNNRKPSTFTPLRSSNVKITFSTTTTRPIVTPKLVKNPALKPAKKPLKLTDKYNNGNEGFTLKGISKPNYSKYKSIGDTSKAPSDSIHTNIPHPKFFSTNEEEGMKPEMNLDDDNVKKESLGQKQPGLYNNWHPTKSLQSSDLSKTKESHFISNMRDALRARLENIPKTPKTVKAKETMMTEATNSDTRVLPPDNLKTSLDNVLKENTSYRCSITCVKEP